MYDYKPPEGPVNNTNDTATVRVMAALLEEIRNPKPAIVITTPPSPQPEPLSSVKNAEGHQFSTANKDIEVNYLPQWVT